MRSDKTSDGGVPCCEDRRWWIGLRVRLNLVALSEGMSCQYIRNRQALRRLPKRRSEASQISRVARKADMVRFSRRNAYRLCNGKGADKGASEGYRNTALREHCGAAAAVSQAHGQVLICRQVQQILRGF